MEFDVRLSSGPWGICVAFCRNSIQFVRSPSPNKPLSIRLTILQDLLICLYFWCVFLLIIVVVVVVFPTITTGTFVDFKYVVISLTPKPPAHKVWWRRLPAANRKSFCVCHTIFRIVKYMFYNWLVLFEDHQHFAFQRGEENRNSLTIFAQGIYPWRILCHMYRISWVIDFYQAGKNFWQFRGREKKLLECGKVKVMKCFSIGFRKKFIYIFYINSKFFFVP